MTNIMQEKSSNKLDFDAAMELARTDPEAFEQFRLDAIEALIASAPARSRQQLRCLQWRIDRERERASSPISACVRIYQMMWDSFAGERGLIDTIRNAQSECPDELHKAKVIAFSRTDGNR
jgi:hypothetical protein